MTGALALLVGALAAAELVPAVLGRVDVRRRDPLPLIVAWVLSMAGLFLAALAGTVLLFLPTHEPGDSVVAGVHGCWAAMRHGYSPRVEELAGTSAVVIVLAFSYQFASRCWRESHRRSHLRARHLAMLRLAAWMDGESQTTLWLAHHRPLAFSLPGRPGVVVATEGLAEHLPTDAVAAVLEHERAHLRGRHHLLVAITDVLATVFSFLRLFREAPAAIRQLVEIAADISAVRSCGVDAMRSALTTVTGHGIPRVALAMGQDGVDARLDRLNATLPAPNRLGRTAICVLAGSTGLLLPFLAGYGLLNAVLWCICMVA